MRKQNKKSIVPRILGKRTQNQNLLPLFAKERKGRVSYEDAQKDPSLRDAFVSSWINPEEIEGCAFIAYDAQGTLSADFMGIQHSKPYLETHLSTIVTAQASVPFPFSNYGKNIEIPIFVHDSFFAHYTLQEATHFIREHEAMHCHQFFNGSALLSPSDFFPIGRFNKEFLSHVLELEAYGHQLTRARLYDLRPHVVDSIVAEYNFSIQQVRCHDAKGNVLERNVREKALSLYLPRNS